MNELHVEKTLVVVPWLDPIVDEVGFDVFSRYAEMFWLPIMGPSALWIMRRIVMGFAEFPGGYEMDTEEIALAVGLSFTQGANCPFSRALRRCQWFGAAQSVHGGLAVRIKLPPVSRRQIQRFPASLKQSLAAWPVESTDHQQLVERAKLVASALITTGDDTDLLE
ncbi:MAG: hypothetical protein WCI32_06065, partial [Actinomycetota bacterium]